MKNQLHKIPGWVGTGLITILNALWLYWGLGEAFYEGWGVPDTPWILFLSISLVAIIFSILTIKFPYLGGTIFILAGLAFAAWWLIPGIRNGFVSLNIVFGRLVLSGGFSLVGILFILDARFNPKSSVTKKSWWFKNARLLFSVCVPVAVGLLVAAVNLPVVLTRVDDGDRSAREIIGNDVHLIWAPSGPGWNWKQDFGGYPSWDSLASYGNDPLGLETNKLSGRHAADADMKSFGLCTYLDENGTELMKTPQNIWRMPTVDEIARSLSRHNKNAACSWRNELGKLECLLSPDKETPLWAPDQPPVYYWAGESFDLENAYYVSYTGFVSNQPKNWGNPRHGYRCVKDPSN